MPPFDFSNTLLGLATVLICGIVGGELLSRLRLPKVTGWIGTGIAMRAAEMPGLEPVELDTYAPFTDFVLGFIAFTVGATLHFATLRNAGKRLALLLAGEALITPLVVLAALFYIGDLDPSVAIILAAIAIAGAPGTTVLVVREARARGILSRTLIAAVGLIDMVAVAVFVFAMALLSSEDLHILPWTEAVAAVGVQMGLALAVGGGWAVLAILLTRQVVRSASVGPTMAAVILGAWGLAEALDISSILACTFAGITLSNLHHQTARSAEEYLTPFGGILFAGFYTLAGMRLDFSLVVPMAGLVALYFLARFAGKALGAFFAMRLSRATIGVQRYLGLALIPHGGVAVGLIFFVQTRPELSSIAETVLTLGLATLAVNQLIGPSAARFALVRANEVGKGRPRLLDFLSEQRIVTGIKGNRKQVISTLADRLYLTTEMPIPKDAFIANVLEREQEESTCLGEGFMIPHAVVETGDRVVGVLGLSDKGLDLAAYDGRPVHCVLLLLTPRSEQKRHLEILAAFAQAITRDGTLREQLYAARSPAHAYEILHADEQDDINYFLDEAMEEAGVGLERRAART